MAKKKTETETVAEPVKQADPIDSLPPNIRAAMRVYNALKGA